MFECSSRKKSECENGHKYIFCLLYLLLYILHQKHILRFHPFVRVFFFVSSFLLIYDIFDSTLLIMFIYFFLSFYDSVCLFLFFFVCIIVTNQIVQRQITPNGYHNNRDISSPSHNDSDYKYGRFDASALHIAHALKQTEIQKAYNKRREKPIDYYLVSK